MASRPTTPRPRRTPALPTRTLPIPAFGMYGLGPEGFRTLRRMILEDRRRWRALQAEIQRLWARIEQVKKARHKVSRRRRAHEDTHSRSGSPA